MNNFYDINDFVVFLMKKWKTFIIITLIVAAVFAGERAVGLLKEYRSQANQSNQEEAESVSSDEPMWIKAQSLIKIAPVYQEIDGEKVDVTYRVIEGYRKLGVSEEVLNSMYDEWYESEKEENTNRRKKLHDYGYILDQEVNYPYARFDFYNQFLLDGVDLNSVSRIVGGDNENENYMMVGFKSTNEKLARQIAESYTAKLTELVQKQVGEFEYEITNTSVLYELPTRSEGTQTSRVAKNNTANTVITMSYILKQTIKGVIWGGILGVLLAVVLIFFMYMMTRKIYVFNDLKKYEVPVLGVGFVKDGKLSKVRGKIYKTLEGNNWDSSGCQKIVKKINAMCVLEEFKNEVIVTGAGNSKYISQFAQKLNEESGNKKFRYVECINENWNIVELLKKGNKKVILVEKFGDSMKDEIEKEIAFLNEQGAEIVGFVGLE